MVVALAALTAAETLVADVLATPAQFVVGTVEDDKLEQFAVQSAIVQGIAYRRLEADLERLLLVAADEPSVIAHKGVLQLGAQVAVELVDVVHAQALAVGRIADERAALGHDVDVAQVAALEFDILVQAGALDIGTSDGNGFALDVAAIDLVGELALGAIVVVDRVKQVGVIVGPLLEGILVTIDTRGNVGADEGCLDKEGARATHGIDQVGVTLPAAEHNDARCQHLVDGRVGLRHAPAALEQRVSAAVERQGHVTSRDVDVESDFGVAQPDAGALAILLAEIVGDGVLDTIGDKAGVVKHLAIDGGVDGKCGVDGHQLLPVK